MNCRYCGANLPSMAKICPACGQPTALYYSDAGSSPDEQTDIRFPAPEKAVPSPSVSSQTPASLSGNVTSDPYSSVPPPPPDLANSSPTPYSFYPVPNTMQPPAPPKKRPLLTIGLGLLVLFLIGDTLAFFTFSHAQNTTGSGGGQATHPPSAGTQGETTAVTTQAANTPALLSPADAQALYTRTTSGPPALHSTLSGPDNYGWDDYAQQNTHCWFTSGAYHSQAQNGYFSPCYAQATKFSNMIFQAQVTVLSGHSGGIVFRANSQNDKGYYFRISTDGTCILNKYVFDSAGQLQTVPVWSGSSKAITRGTHQQNLVSVLAQGPHFYLFVNKQYVASASDSTYQTGQIGIYTDSDAGSVEASFLQAQVWTL